MADTQHESRFAENLQITAEKLQRAIASYLNRHGPDDSYTVMDPVVITRTFQQVFARLAADPTLLMERQRAWWNDSLELWQRSAAWWMGTPVKPVIEPTPDDRRFKDAQWTENPGFDFIKQFYLLASRHMLETVDRINGFDAGTRQKALFYTRQYVDALAPTNFVATNPQALKATVESGGENLLKGLQHLLDDLERGKGRISVRMTDLEAFRLGENIAITPGKVVFQNELMQLLQYSPATETVYKRPLLIIPPWINKFYILDLKPKNSFIKWAVEQGHTVFVVSWVNPGPALAHKHFENYMLEGPLAAMDAIEKATGEKTVNAIGYCIGGTLLSCTLAYLKAKGQHRVESATFFTTLLDYSDIGELAVFVDEEQLEMLDRHMAKKGYLEGRYMADVFSLLRENELIWSFVINNYLLGREPMAFDLLYWNSDSTRMPAAMHSFYLRNMYLENNLRKPGGITLAGVPIDLRTVTTPAYLLSTKEDHIAPWKTTYAATQLFQGPNRFVLGGSGHIAGVINPPVANKYNYWVNEKPAATPDEWFAAAQPTPGSWWTDWGKWVGQFGGEQVKARQPGDRKLKVIEDAPGAYVKSRAGS